MRNLIVTLIVLSATLGFWACENGESKGSSQDDYTDTCIETLIPSPCQKGYDPQLERLARMYDRQFHAFNAYGMALNSDVVVPIENEEDRALIERFLRTTDGWDFEEYSGKSPLDVITDWQQAAGLYAGVGVAADAYRYGVLRDQKYPEEEVKLARKHLTDALEAWHIAYEITGTKGVIARGLLRTDIPHADVETVPLFDDNGNPLPLEKNNGTWRADNSGGKYPNWVWIDSCSRDQYIGWVAGLAAAWEVIKDDPAFSDELKQQMKNDARELGLALKVIRPSGFDLEIPDADGRTTYHGYLNENNFDRIYLPFLPIKNGMYSIMALGIVAALNYVADDPELKSYLYDTLIGKRKLHIIAKHNQIGVYMGVKTNYSNVNMAFMGAHLALRYIEDEAARDALKIALGVQLYDYPFRTRQPKEQGSSLFDFIYAAGMADATAWQGMQRDFYYEEIEAINRGLQTLKEFSVPPFWETAVLNCDEAEIATGICYGLDGTRLDLLGYVGRGGKLVSVQPVPMRIRPKSNYYWRSNPYEVNGEGSNGLRLIGGVDFRYAYWLGRWIKRAPLK